MGMIENEPSNPCSEIETIEVIRSAIRAEGERLRNNHPLLKRQNLIGAIVFLASIAGVTLSAYGYLSGLIGALTCIVLVALFTSLLHELEHDLIHWQYFKDKPLIHHLMMLGVWVFRPGTINPWIRRHLHFLHHKVSGTEKDLEERGIGNGMDYRLARTLIMFDPLVGNIIKILRENKGKKAMRIGRLLLAYFPFGVLSVGIWYTFLLFHLVSVLATASGSPIAWSSTQLSVMAYLNAAVVILIGPHYLRSFCLILISSTMHYYGNVTSLLKQTQVLNAWYFWPFQLFCFNFGSTHAIHHFVVGEPFYIRQLTAKAAHKVMRDNGVPFNDLGTFSRANQFPERSEYDKHASMNAQGGQA